MRSERLKKYCSHPAGWNTEAVFLSFGFISAQLQDCFEPALSPKPRQNPKILAPNGHSISLNTLDGTLLTPAPSSFGEQGEAAGLGGQCQVSFFGHMDDG